MPYQTSSLTTILILLSLNFHLLHSIELSIGIGISVGGGGGGETYTPPPVGGSGETSPAPTVSPTACPPILSPPQPTSPLPTDFPNMIQYRAYNVIQSFKKTLTCDPQNIAASWFGPRPCNYTGFICDTPPNNPNNPTIAGIDFNGYHLCAPTLSGFLNALPDLAFFHANSNNFAGTVPAVNNQPFLYELDLSNNLLTGAFPLTVVAISTLTFLDLRYNKFSGAVPGSLFSLPSADVIFINNNLITGGLPATTFRSDGAAYLTLANNGFTGSIPISIGNASSSLIELLLLGNSLSGCLPYEAGLLKQATVFDIGNNQVTGSIPLSFGCLKKVEQLNLANNKLYGEVPDIVCSLATSKYGRLVNLSLSGNYFTSIGHTCYRLLKSGVLDVRRNCIPGMSGQRSMSECWSFLAKPKCCPYLSCIPCELPWGGKASRPSKPAGPPKKYVTYSAVHRKHGR